jgi:hypothetical protein
MKRKAAITTGVAGEAWAVAEVAYQAGLTPDAIKEAREKLRHMRENAGSREVYRAIQGIIDQLASAERYAQRSSDSDD